jgi:predicted DCC family thiol-disulfide oxidoreductase YuxK
MISSTATHYPLTLLYDGSCPVCRLEMTEMMRRNHAGLLKFADMSAPDFDLAAYTQVQHTTWEAINAELHGMRPDGSFVLGVDAVRLAYEAVYAGMVWKPTRWPVLGQLLWPLAHLAYRLFAKHRIRISSALAPLIVRIEARRAHRRMQACQNGQGVCDLPR